MTATKRFYREPARLTCDASGKIQTGIYHIHSETFVDYVMTYMVSIKWNIVVVVIRSLKGYIHTHRDGNMC